MAELVSEREVFPLAKLSRDVQDHPVAHERDAVAHASSCARLGKVIRRRYCQPQVLSKSSERVLSEPGTHVVGQLLERHLDAAVDVHPGAQRSSVDSMELTSASSN